MRFLVITYGTEGDTRPLAALCRALMDAGHETHLLADRGTLGSAEALQVPSTTLAGDIRGVLQPGGAISTVVQKRGFRDTAGALAQIANTHAEDWLRTAIAIGRNADAVILSGLAGFVGLSAAEYLGIKAIGTGLIPITPTAEFPSPFISGRIPAFLNHASHRFVNAAIWRAFRKATNAARATVCKLPPRRTVWAEHPMLYGVSRTLLPRPGDWPRNAEICGQWSMPAGGWRPSEELSRFLEAGEAPIYFGFGSMSGFKCSQLLDAVVSAAAGRRALFYPGWSGVDPSGLPGNFFVLGETPHDWLFPQTSLVVHHGGSGTTHSAARAGVPSVVVPFAGDQFFWADRLCKLGVAARLSSSRALQPAALAEAITLALRPEVRARANDVGDAMRAENGLLIAVTRIQEIMTLL